MHEHHPDHRHSRATPVGRFLAVALGATICLVVAEWIGGYLGHSIEMPGDVTMPTRLPGRRDCAHPGAASANISATSAGIITAFVARLMPFIEMLRRALGVRLVCGRYN